MMTYYVKQTIWLAMVLSAPVVLTALALGLLLGFLQAVFQLQDQAMPFAMKLVTVTAILVTLGPWLAQQLIGFTETLFMVVSTGDYD